MRICTITCNNADNYGARLQAFALQRHLESLGHDVKIIDYEPDYVSFKTRLWYNPGLNIKEWAKLILRYRQRKLEIAKHNALEEFSRQNLKLTKKYHSIDELRADPPQADMYIAGSDQIWNVTLPTGKDLAYYLDFGSKNIKRRSYAASFAITQIPEHYCDFIKKGLSNFDEITVREASAIDICKQFGIAAKVVCDPVFLLPKEFWSLEFANDEGIDDNYVLVYDFMRSPEIKKLAKKIAKERNLSIYSVSPWHFSYADKNHCACSPQSFVALIKNASVVISNSLHATIFSIIFEKDFYVVNREDGLNIRMRELLVRYGMEDRIV